MNKRLIRILTSGAILSASMLTFKDQNWVSLSFYLAAYLIVGYDVILYALKNIIKGEVFDENFLMSIATIGAFFVGGYAEAVSVMLFFQVGEFFQCYAEDKSRKSIRELMDIRPDYANLVTYDGFIKTDPNAVKVGDHIIIRPGEKVPLDGIVIEGNSMLDTSALTGESVPRETLPGSEILGGCVNINGLLTVEVTKIFGDSTVSKILDLVENSGNKKSRSENFIRRFARYYTPVVVVIAGMLAVVPPLLLQGETFSDWIYRALIFLVVSCPCALVVSIPLSFFGGIGGASIKGILVKGGNYLETLAYAETIAFDKTGTLTKGVFNVQEIHPMDMSKEELLELAAYAESFSKHPISASLLRAYGNEINRGRISDMEEIAGHGISAKVDGRNILAGNEKLMRLKGIKFSDNGPLAETIVHIAVDNVYGGFITISDEMKVDSREAIEQLHSLGVLHTAMLTGDNKAVADKVGHLLGIEKIYSELLPTGKVEIIEKLLTEKRGKGKLIFVGDGINDAPVLARADVGIAMGGLGSDAAIEAADVVIMTDEPSKIPLAIKIARKTLRIAKQNIVFAIGVKVLVLILGVAGLATMWEAVFADVGVTVLVVLNAFRALR